MNSEHLIFERQFGFRQKHYTTTALLDRTNEWFTNMDRGLFNLVFLDLQKVFDTVNSTFIVLRNQRRIYFNLFLSDRIQRCRVNDKVSNPKSVRCGVPQGSILDPLLFLICINDLPVCLRHTTIRKYADDATLTGSGDSFEKVEKAINHDLKNVREWLLANKLSLNLVKTKYLLIGSRFNLRN